MKCRAADAAGEVISPTKLVLFIVKNISAPEVMASIVSFEPEKPAKPVEEKSLAAEPEALTQKGNRDE